MDTRLEQGEVQISAAAHNGVRGCGVPIRLNKPKCKVLRCVGMEEQSSLSKAVSAKPWATLAELPPILSQPLPIAMCPLGLDTLFKNAERAWKPPGFDCVRVVKVDYPTRDNERWLI
jgi:hypothetical protein